MSRCSLAARAGLSQCSPISEEISLNEPSLSNMSRIDIPVIGLIGCGPWGANILRDLQILGCRVLVAARHESSRDRARAGGADFVGSIDEVVAAAVDGFVVAVNTKDHVAMVEHLLPCGKPVFVEKPLTDKVEDARRLALRANGLVFVMDKWRYHAGVQKMAELLRTGDVGNVVGIHTRRIQRAWHHDCDEPWTLLPHDMAIVEELLGDVPPLQSVAHDRVADTTYGVMARFGTQPWVVMECSGRSHITTREVSVFCDGGIIVLAGGYAESVLVYRDAGRRLAPEPEHIQCPGEWPLLAELREFVGYLRGGQQPRADIHSALRHVEVIDAIMRWPGTAG